MGYVNTGLFNNGQTQFFKISYDEALSDARGLDLATGLLAYCDEDFAWLQALFPGVSVGTPIAANIANISNPASGGASWSGWGMIPLGITLKLGEFSVTGGDPLTLLRYLMVVETSEMFMRERQWAFFNRFNDWFGAFNEGSKGESLSLLIGVRFLREMIPQAATIPGIGAFSFGVSDLWLNGVRDDHVDDNMDTISHDDVTGCGTLFLFFLRDQLGFGVETIIGAGGNTLSDVYSHLTGDDRANAFMSFVDLVNLHYPSGSGPYSPRLESVFPVPNLSLLLAPPEVSWVSNGLPDGLQVVLDQVVPVDTKVALATDDSTIVDVPMGATVMTGTDFTRVALTIPQQAATFTSKTVTITAAYAGQTLTQTIQVVRPEDLPLPPLEIDVNMADDPCQEVFVEGSALVLAIKNINVFSNRQGLVYKWSVHGAAVAKDDTPELSIANLPAAGTQIVVEVVVTSPLKLVAKGHYEFATTPRLTDLEELERQVMCRVRNLKQINAQIAPWVPIEDRRLRREHLVMIEEQSRLAAREMEQVASSIQKLQKMRAKA